MPPALAGTRGPAWKYCAMDVTSLLLVSVTLLLLVPYAGSAVCEDSNSKCQYWASKGECFLNPGWMECFCPKSCGTPSICGGADKMCSCLGLIIEGECRTSTLRSDCAATCNEFFNTRCNSSQLPSHALLVGSKKEYTFLERATVQCDTVSAQAAGGNDVICGRQGAWVSKGHIIQCKPLECPKPKAIANGVVVGNEFGENGVIAYECNPGYHVTSGDKTRTCRGPNFWVWSGEEPVCSKIQCKLPEPVANATYTVHDNSFEGQVTYKCLPGFEPDLPHMRRTCLADGTWSKEDVRCKLITCKTPPAALHAYYLGIDFRYQTEVTYLCNPGYESKINPMTRQCLANGSWTPLEVHCSEISCGPPPIEENSLFVGGDFTFLGQVTYICNTGYYGNNVTKTCQADKKWSNQTIDCRRVDCGPPPQLAMTEMFVSTTSFQSEASYRCKGNYSVIGGETLKFCYANGSWVGEDLICLDRDAFMAAVRREVAKLRPGWTSSGVQDAATQITLYVVCVLVTVVVTLLCRVVFDC